MTQQTITLHISRYNPETDTQPHLEAYTVTIQAGMSVMQALDAIYEQQDATLAYYDHAACAQGICGRCNILIDGKMGLMCQTQARDGMTLQAPQKARIVRDLVTERGEK